VNKTATSAHNL